MEFESKKRDPQVLGKSWSKKIQVKIGYLRRKNESKLYEEAFLKSIFDDQSTIVAFETKIIIQISF